MEENQKNTKKEKNTLEKNIFVKTITDNHMLHIWVALLFVHRK